MIKLRVLGAASVVLMTWIIGVDKLNADQGRICASARNAATPGKFPRLRRLSASSFLQQRWHNAGARHHVQRPIFLHSPTRFLRSPTISDHATDRSTTDLRNNMVREARRRARSLLARSDNAMHQGRRLPRLCGFTRTPLRVVRMARARADIEACHLGTAVFAQCIPEGYAPSNENILWQVDRVQETRQEQPIAGCSEDWRANTEPERWTEFSGPTCNPASSMGMPDRCDKRGGLTGIHFHILVPRE